MRIVKDNPVFDAPREKLKSYFSRGDLYLASDVHLSFVCGRADGQMGDQPSLRSRFIDYVKAEHTSEIVCVRAEEAAKELLRQGRRRSNLSAFEKLIADVVDSVVIFPESPGSIAELGYFSAFDEINEKTLVAVLHNHQGDSFISLGPIHHISTKSIYRPIPVVIGDNVDEALPILIERLLGPATETRPYRNRFDLLPWKELDDRKKLCVMGELLNVVGALTENDLFNLVYSIFGPYDAEKIRMLLSLLVATGRVSRNQDGDIFSASEEMARWLEGDQDERVSVKSRWTAAYGESQPEVLEELRRLRHE